MDLADNKVIEDGISGIARALESEMCGLRTLYLAGNKIRSSGIEVLAPALKENRTLTALSLRDNGVTPKSMSAMRKAASPYLHLELS
eukprot:gene5281-6416_t